MAKADPTGYLVISGRTLDSATLARVTGGEAAEVGELLKELEQNGVFSRDAKGRIYCRRMLREVKKAAIAKKNGKTGGNPTLCNQRDIPPSDNLQDKPEVKPHKPSAICQDEKETPTGVSKKRGSRIAPEWVLSAEGRAYAVSLGLLDYEIDFQAEKFLNYWLGKTGQNATKADWDATWRNWVQEAFERKQKNVGGKVALPAQIGGGPMLTVQRGTPQHNAWLAFKQARGEIKNPAANFLDKLTVPAEWPPEIRQSA